MSDEPVFQRFFEGQARVGKVLAGMEKLVLRPEDFRSPASLQMALTRIMEAAMKMMEGGMKEKYIAEVSFTDDQGNPVVFTVDLGESLPPLPSDKVKVRIVVEFIPEEEG